MGDAGAQSLGYFSGVFRPDALAVAAVGVTGALHVWVRQYVGATWEPVPAVGGHYGGVVDLDWGPRGCLLTVGTDQTARVHVGADSTWHEVARPQVHGYNFTCATFVFDRAAL